MLYSGKNVTKYPQPKKVLLFFLKEMQTIICIWLFLHSSRGNLKKLGEGFQVSIHFSPYHPKPKVLMDGLLNSVGKSILNKTEPLFLGFLHFQYFIKLQSNIKTRGIAPLTKMW